MIRLTLTAVAVSIYVLSVASASAATVTFTGTPQFDVGGTSPWEWAENGIVATSTDGNFAYFHLPDSLHMDTPGNPFLNFVSFEMPGTNFNAVSFDIYPGNYRLLLRAPDHTRTPATYENIRVRGFSGANLVAEDVFAMGAQPFTYLFDSSFESISKLVVYAITPTSLPPDGYIYECDFPCAHFNIDNITLAPVPAPPSIVLFLSGLAGLFGFNKWRKRSSLRLS